MRERDAGALLDTHWFGKGGFVFIDVRATSDIRQRLVFFPFCLLFRGVMATRLPISWRCDVVDIHVELVDIAERHGCHLRAGKGRRAGEPNVTARRATTTEPRHGTVSW